MVETWIKMVIAEIMAGIHYPDGLSFTNSCIVSLDNIKSKVIFDRQINLKWFKVLDRI